MQTCVTPAKPAKTGISVIGCKLALPFSPSKPSCVFMTVLLQGQALLPQQERAREGLER